MRADKLLMLGVGAIGLFSVYRLVTGERGEGAEPGPSPSPSGEPPPQPQPTGLAYLGDPLKFRQYAWYRGRLSMGALPPFDAMATRETIATALQVLGFDNVQVFMSRAELPSNWPAGEVSDDPNARWFAGRWSQGAMTLARPASLQAIWNSSAATNQV